MSIGVTQKAFFQPRIDIFLFLVLILTDKIENDAKYEYEQ
jgi:hypothetical protein